MVAAIGLVDPLDHFLASLMLEIDIDIGWLASLSAHEPFEQQFGAHRVDGGDAKAVADRRIGRRSPALAQNVFRARKIDDRVDRQKIGCVIELGDETQLMLQLGPCLVVDAVWIAGRGFCPGKALKLLLRCTPAFTDFIRILIAQLFKGKAALLGDSDTSPNWPCVPKIAHEQPVQLVGVLKVPVCDLLASLAQIVDRAFLADTGHNILQHSALGHVVEDIASGHCCDARLLCHLREPSQP